MKKKNRKLLGFYIKRKKVETKKKINFYLTFN